MVDEETKARDEERRKRRRIDVEESEKDEKGRAVKRTGGENRAEGEIGMKGVKAERGLSWSESYELPPRELPARESVHSERRARATRNSPARSLVPRSMYLRAPGEAGGLHICTSRIFARNPRRFVAPRDVVRARGYTAACISALFIAIRRLFIPRRSGASVYTLVCGFRDYTPRLKSVSDYALEIEDFELEDLEFGRSDNLDTFARKEWFC